MSIKQPACCSSAGPDRRKGWRPSNQFSSEGWGAEGGVCARGLKNIIWRREIIPLYASTLLKLLHAEPASYAACTPSREPRSPCSTTIISKVLRISACHEWRLPCAYRRQEFESLSPQDQSDLLAQASPEIQNKLLDGLPSEVSFIWMIVFPHVMKSCS